MTWSKIRNKLENEYLADSLRGHIRYFATSYRKFPDREGRAAICYDGREIIEGSYGEQWSKAELLPRDEKFERRTRYLGEFPFIDGTALKYGQFDNRCFYNAFREFDNQSIEESLNSENLLVRIFAVMDRRVGKRRLLSMKDSISEEPEVLRRFFEIRVRNENLF